MQSPVPLELAKVTLRRLLVMNLKFIVTNTFKVVTTAGSTTGSYLHLPQLLSGQPKRELVATPLVLEPIDAPQGLRH